MNNVLHVENITMQFGGVVAVDNLNIDVNEGEIVALIGPNGAGKTTAFNVITGVYQPTNGQVHFNGEVIISNTPTGKMKKEYLGKEADRYAGEKVLAPTPDKITAAGIARTFQNIRLWKSMTAFENVLVAKHFQRKQGLFASILRINRIEEGDRRVEALEILEEVGLGDYAGELSTSLPYGLQRRLEIGRALAAHPKLLLLDEPAAGMNPQETLELRDFILSIREKFNLTILVIEHHMDFVMGISDRIYAIDFGELIATGTPSEIQNNQKVIDAYLGVAQDA